jgi:hypothetical protein
MITVHLSDNNCYRREHFSQIEKCHITTKNLFNKKDLIEALKIEDIKDWSLHYAKDQDALNKIKLEDISVHKACTYTTGKALGNAPSDLNIISCLKDTSMHKSGSIKEFAICTENLFKNLQTDVYVKSNFPTFYHNEVYNPSMDPNALQTMTTLYKRFDTLTPKFVTQEIRTLSSCLSEKMFNLVDPYLIQQIFDLSFVNEIFAGLALLPHILQYMGFSDFWSMIFPFFLQIKGAVQFFVRELKMNLVVVKTEIPRYISNISFVVKHKWPLLTGTVVLTCLMYQPITQFIQPMINSTYGIFFKELSCYEKFVKEMKCTFKLK